MKRSEAAEHIANMLLSGSVMTAQQLRNHLDKNGKHEASRVLSIVKNDWGVPVRRTKAGAYYVDHADRKQYASDKAETLKTWGYKAEEMKKLRKFITTLTVIEQLKSDISSDAYRELVRAIGARL